MKILAIDDDNNILTILRMILEGQEYSVDCANDADSALVKLRENEYDFVLVDLKMPKHDGLWFMKHADLPKKTKVLMVSAFVSKDAVKQMFEFGISGYMSKPFEANDVIRHIEFHANQGAPDEATA